MVQHWLATNITIDYSTAIRRRCSARLATTIIIIIASIITVAIIEEHLFTVKQVLDFHMPDEVFEAIFLLPPCLLRMKNLVLVNDFIIVKNYQK